MAPSKFDGIARVDQEFSGALHELVVSLPETMMLENCDSMPIFSTQVGDPSEHAVWLSEIVTSLIR